MVTAPVEHSSNLGCGFCHGSVTAHLRLVQEWCVVPPGSLLWCVGAVASVLILHADAFLMQRVFCDNQELAFEQQWSPSQQQQQQPVPQQPPPPVQQEQLGQSSRQASAAPENGSSQPQREGTHGSSSS